MKNKIILIFTLLVFASAPAFSQPQIQDIQNAANKFSEDVTVAIPFNSTIGLNWSDAYIGQLIGVPPHFGIGISTGFTTLGTGSIDGILNAIGGGAQNAIPSFLRGMGMPLPAYTVEGRIGGFILPFDIGFKFGILPLDLQEFAIDYLLIGVDVRYAVIDHKLSPIKLSVGVGYNYMKGGITIPIGDASFQLTEGGQTYTFSLNDPKIGFIWGTHCFELKGQVSFKLPFITPYAGAGLSMAFSNAGYRFSSNLSVATGGSPVDINDPIIQDALKALGISNITENGFGSIIDSTSFNMRLFGGISFNLALFRIDLSVMYNLTGGNYGFTIGGRFQL